MNRSLARDLDLTVVFGLVVVPATLFSPNRYRHRRVHWNSILLTLIPRDRTSIKRVQAALATNETWPWRRLAAAIDINLFPRPIRRQCQTGNLSWVDVSEQLLVCPPPPAAGRECLAFDIAITFFVAASGTPLVNAIGYGDVLSARRVSFGVAVVLAVLTRRWTTSETFEAVSVPSLRKLAVCQVVARPSGRWWATVA